MSFKDEVAAFEQKITDAIKTVEGVGSDLLARILHKHAVQTNAEAIKGVVNLGMTGVKATMTDIVASGLIAADHVKDAVAYAEAPEAPNNEPAPAAAVADETPAPVATPVEGTGEPPATA